MKIACCIWALSGPEIDILRQVRDIGFDCIDIQPSHLQTLESQLLAQELGLTVSCVGASFGIPTGAALDGDNDIARQAAVDHISQSIVHAAQVGADTVYIVPNEDSSSEALERFAESIKTSADTAQSRAVKLAIEHFPGTALPTAGATLEFIRQVGHPNLYLLLDTGHIQMSGEDPATVIQNAGDLLGYVHLDDNDGINDLHWSLHDGVMTEESLITTLNAIESIGYQGALSLELSSALRKPANALSESRDALLRAIHHTWLPK